MNTNKHTGEASTVKTDSDFNTVIKGKDKYLFDRSIKYDKPPTAIELNGAIFGTLGNFSLVIGKAKSRKTFLMTSLIAAATSNSEINLFKGVLTEDKREVIYFDTEQGNYHISKVDERIYRLKNTDKNSFDIYALRPASTKERLEYVELIIKEYKNLGLVIIDGIRDLVKDINSPQEATEMSDKLLRLTANYNINIIVILHQNKGNEHARGHLGTELQNKAETVASVTVHPKDKELSIVSAEMTRNKAFEDFAFRVEKGLPVLAEIPFEKSKKTLEPEDVGNEKIKNILLEAFGLAPINSSSKLKSFFRNELGIGENKARDFIFYSEAEGMIINQSKNKKRYEYVLHESLKEKLEDEPF